MVPPSVVVATSAVFAIERSAVVVAVLVGVPPPLLVLVALNVAIMVVVALSVKEQVVDVADGHPVQPSNVEVDESGAAVSVIRVPSVKLKEQVPSAVEQSIPAGVLETLPLPVPLIVTFSWSCVGDGMRLNTAVIVLFIFDESTTNEQEVEVSFAQGPVLQLLKVELVLLLIA